MSVVYSSGSSNGGGGNGAGKEQEEYHTIEFNENDIVKAVERCCAYYGSNADVKTPCPEWIIVGGSANSIMHPVLGYCFAARLARAHRYDVWYILSTRQIVISPLRCLIPKESEERAARLESAAHNLDPTVLHDELSRSSLGHYRHVVTLSGQEQISFDSRAVQKFVLRELNGDARQ